ncbi:MAG: ATP-binding cassette domain-containing protein [Candidatus Omnitrophica bacterium]|nr:ATP-binding cassette domain-containing protein [Candidatus Omnitrophota bacterium]
MDKPIIEVRNLGKRYLLGEGGGECYRALRDVMVNSVKKLFKGKYKKNELQEIWALKQINFNVQAGEKVGIIGRNGAGKSTLLKILSEITEPTEGEVLIRGRIASLLEVGTGFHPELTGKENIFMNGAILGMRRAEIKAKYDEIVSFAEIEKFLDTPVKRYSSGMYVRLAFAVAAHLEPEILIVDEVLAVGDIMFQKKCLGKMSEVAKGGRTVLFVSHNMEAVEKLCTRAILLSEGKVVMEGETDEVIKEYTEKGKYCIGEQTWQDINKAPGDDVVRLLKACVLNKNKKVCTNFDIRDSVSIKLEYQVLEAGHHLHVHLSFIKNGHVIFISKDNLDSQWRDTVCPKGYYRSVCQVPGDFLDEGTVSIYCAITTVGMANVGHVSAQDLLTFQVFDGMDTAGVRGNYPLHWVSSSVRPRLNWVVEKTA